MAIACFLSHDADNAIDDTIVFVLLRWLFRGIYNLVPVVVPVLALCHVTLVSGDANCNGIILHQCQWHHVLLLSSHDQKCNIASYLNCLDISSAMVPLMMP